MNTYAMTIHYYESKSPSDAVEQIARLDAPIALSIAHIPSVIWAEDALSIVHRVPTVLFDQHILVPDDCVESATRTICSALPYTRVMDDEVWKDSHLYNKDRPHAFNLNTTTFILTHQDQKWASENVCRFTIFSSSTFGDKLLRKNPSASSSMPPQSGTLTFRTRPAPV